MHGGKYRNAPFSDHFTNRNFLIASFKIRSESFFFSKTLISKIRNYKSERSFFKNIKSKQLRIDVHMSKWTVLENYSTVQYIYSLKLIGYKLLKISNKLLESFPRSCGRLYLKFFFLWTVFLLRRISRSFASDLNRYLKYFIFHSQKKLFYCWHKYTRNSIVHNLRKWTRH